MADTWNAIGTTFNAIYMNISNGAGGSAVGAAASRAFRLDDNGTPIFEVNIAGSTIEKGFLGVGNYSSFTTYTFAPGDPVNAGPTAIDVSFNNPNLIVNQYISGDLSGIGIIPLAVYPGVKHTGAGTANIAGIDVESVINSDSTGTFNTNTALFFDAINYGSGNITYVIGIEGYPVHAGSGTNTNIVGIRTGTTLDLNAASTNSYGIVITTANITVGCTITNNYGLYLEDNSGIASTLNYNLYSAGSGVNHFNSVVEIGNFGTSTNYYYAPGDPTFQQTYTIGSPVTPLILLNDHSSGDFSSKALCGYVAYTAYKHTGVGSVDVSGFDVEPGINSDSTGPINSVNGAYFGPFNAGSGAVSSLYGFYFQPAQYGNGLVNSMTGFYTNPYVDNTTAVSAAVFNLYGIQITPPTLVGTPTVSNNYGIYIQDMAGIATTLNYNIYSDGVSTVNHFHGITEFGDYATSTNMTFAPGDPVNFSVIPLTDLNPNLVINKYYNGDYSGSNIYSVIDYTGIKHTGVGGVGVFAFDFEPTINSDSTGPISPFAGLYFAPSNFGTGLIDTLYGGYFAPSQIGAGTHTTDSIAVNTSYYIDDGGGSNTITNLYGVAITTPTLVGTPTITNNYGIHISDQSGIGATLNYNIYSAGDGFNHFKGYVGINDTNPAYQLSVTGSTHINGVMGIGSNPDPNIMLYASADIADPSAYTYGGSFLRSITLTADNSNNVYGGSFLSAPNGSAFNYNGSYIGGFFASQGGAAVGHSVASMIGGSFLAYGTTAGAITDMRAGYFTLQNLNAGCVVTSAYGVYIDNTFNFGTYTNTYGIYIGTLTGGTQTNTPYAIYSSDAGASVYIAGASTLGSAINITQGTITSNIPQINGTVTWNNAGVNFTAWKLNVTATANAGASLLLDMQVGSVTKFSVDYVGTMEILGNVNASANFSFFGSSSKLYFRSTGINMQMASDSLLGWGSTSDGAAGIDTILARDAAGTLAQRDGTNAQTFNIYETYSGGGANYSRMQLVATGASFEIVSQAAGTGTVRSLQLKSATGTNFYFGGNGAVQWRVNGTTGDLEAQTDATYSIGTNSGNRPKNIDITGNLYTGGVIIAQNGVYLGNGSQGSMIAQSDGVWTLRDNAATSWNLLQFGGTSSSYPALKRSSATLQVRLADDSGFAAITTGDESIGLAAAATFEGNSPSLQVHTAVMAGGFARYSADTVGGDIWLAKSRNATVGSHTIVQSGDTIGEVRFAGSNGTSFDPAAAIKALVDGTPGASNDMPGRLSFLTTTDGTATLSEALRIDNAQRLVTGGVASQSIWDALTPQVQLNTATNALGMARYSADSTGNNIWIAKSRNATVGSHTIVQSGDNLGTIRFAGSDGTNFIGAAAIQGAVDGTPGASSDMPGRLVFYTTPDGSGTLTERLRINADGQLIGTPGSVTPATLGTNGQYTLTPTSNTNFRISFRGTDGTTRVGNITLA